MRLISVSWWMEARTSSGAGALRRRRTSVPSEAAAPVSGLQKTQIAPTSMNSMQQGYTLLTHPVTTIASGSRAWLVRSANTVVCFTFLRKMSLNRHSMKNSNSLKQSCKEPRRQRQSRTRQRKHLINDFYHLWNIRSYLYLYSFHSWVPTANSSILGFEIRITGSTP